MENPNVIYEKKFPYQADELDAAFADAETSTLPRRDPSDFYKRLVESTVKVVIPGRMENQGFFTAQAKEIAERNEIDTTITEYEDRLVAEFRIRDDSPSYGMKGIIEYADDIFFGCDEGEVVVSVVYYTHATYRSGKKITPEDERKYLM